jgi:hypothetical protein
MPRRSVLGGLAGLALLATAVLAAAVPAAAFEHRGDDWAHAKSVVRRLAAHPPDGPVVYLLGGSSARECTVTDADWRAQIEGAGVPRVRVFNLGSAGQTYAQDMWLMGKVPDVPTLVLIGVNVGRYTPRLRAVSTGEIARAGSLTAGRTYDQHAYHWQVRSWQSKRLLVDTWLRERYPLFRERYAQHAGKLEQLVAACWERGFHPVLLELPLDLIIVGAAWDAARSTYAAGCREVAATHHIPYVDLVPDAGLVSSDFYDLTHLIEPGRVKWQALLSRLVVKRLGQYHLDTVTSRKESASDNG